MENQSYLSVIIPAYNEGDRKENELRQNVEEIGRYLRAKNITHEIIAVSDGSKDDTVQVFDSLRSAVDKMEIIDRRENRGKWFSVREGLLKANGKYRLLTDADGATAISNLDNFLSHMEAGKDIIIGSRDLQESRIQKHQPKWKELLGDFGNFLIQFMMGLRGIKDTQCGFKVLSEKAVNDIIPQLKVDRWGGDFEMLMLAKKMGYEIVEVPVVWVDAGQSLVGIKGYFLTFKELFQVKWRMLAGKYNIHPIK